MAKQVFESYLRLYENSGSNEPQINWLLIFTTSLLTAGIVLIIGLFTISPVFPLSPSNSLIFSSFLAMELVAGVYVYKNATYRKMMHSLIAILITPLLFLLIFIAISLFADNSGKILSFSTAS